MFLVSAIFLVAVLIVGVLSLFFPPTITRREAHVPPDATCVGPNGYMHVWDDGMRINIVFRNMPWASVKFDRRTAHDFADWLRTVPLNKTDV